MCSHGLSGPCIYCRGEEEHREQLALLHKILAAVRPATRPGWRLRLATALHWLAYALMAE